MPDDDLAVFRHFANFSDAELAASVLRAGGVECFLREAHGGARPETTLVARGITLFVREGDVKLAEEILAAEPAEGEQTAGVCASCGRPFSGGECWSCNDPGYTPVIDHKRMNRVFDRLQWVVILILLAIGLIVWLGE